jgi:hypothetical protein
MDCLLINNQQTDKRCKRWRGDLMCQPGIFLQLQSEPYTTTTISTTHMIETFDRDDDTDHFDDTDENKTRLRW